MCRDCGRRRARERCVRLQSVAPRRLTTACCAVLLYDWNAQAAEMGRYFQSLGEHVSIHDTSLETVMDAVLEEREAGRRVVVLLPSSTAAPFGAAQLRFFKVLQELVPDTVADIYPVGHCLYGCRTAERAPARDRVPVYLSRYVRGVVTPSAKSVRAKYFVKSGRTADVSPGATSSFAPPLNVLVAPSHGADSMMQQRSIVPALLRLAHSRHWNSLGRSLNLVFKLHGRLYSALAPSGTERGALPVESAVSDALCPLTTFERDMARRVHLAAGPPGAGPVALVPPEEHNILPFFEAFDVIIADLSSSVPFESLFFFPKTTLCFHARGSADETAHNHQKTSSGSTEGKEEGTSATEGDVLSDVAAKQGDPSYVGYGSDDDVDGVDPFDEEYPDLFHTFRTSSQLEALLRRVAGGDPLGSGGSEGTVEVIEVVLEQAPFGIYLQEQPTHFGGIVDCLVPGSPADQCGLIAPRDTLISVDGVSTEHLRYEDTLAVITEAASRARQGHAVVLHLVRRSEADDESGGAAETGDTSESVVEAASRPVLPIDGRSFFRSKCGTVDGHEVERLAVAREWARPHAFARGGAGGDGELPTASSAPLLLPVALPFVVPFKARIDFARSILRDTPNDEWTVAQYVQAAQRLLAREFSGSTSWIDVLAAGHSLFDPSPLSLELLATAAAVFPSEEILRTGLAATGLTTEQLGDATYVEFVVQHLGQLIVSGLPKKLWHSLYIKLMGDELDAGEHFSYGIDESSDEGRQWQVLVMDEEMDAEQDVFLLDHAVTAGFYDLRVQLENSPALVSRVRAILGMGDGAPPPPDGDSGEADPSDVTDSEEFAAESLLKSLPDVDIVPKTPSEVLSHTWNRLWAVLQSYKLRTGPSADSETCVWYLLDEFGARIRHDERPSFGYGVLFCLPRGQAFSFIWPLRNVDQGEEVTRDHLANVSQALRSPLRILTEQRIGAAPFCDARTVWEKRLDDCLVTSASAAVSVCEVTHGTMPRIGAISDGPLHVFTDDPVVKKLLTRPGVTFASSITEADVVWLAAALPAAERSRLTAGGARVINQFPATDVLAHRHTLARFLYNAVGEPTWLPMTFDMGDPGDFAAMVGEYHLRAANEAADNTWLVTPCGGGSAGTRVVTDNLLCVARLCREERCIVSKYLQNPAEFGATDVSHGMKFSLHFRVVVRSFRPLDAFVYDEFGVQLAAAPFTMAYMESEEVHFPRGVVQDGGRVFAAELEREHSTSGMRWRNVQSRIHAALRELLASISIQRPDIQGSAYRGEFGVDVELDADWKPHVADLSAPASSAHVSTLLAAATSYYNDVFGCLFLGESTNMTKIW